jgi:glycosyltransferase involved in cell wall biosynthesis
VTTSINVPSLPARFTVIGGAGSAAPTTESAPHVLLVTEGTYPHAWGGVSTWCDSLVTVLPDVEFHIVAIIAAPDIPPVYDVPSNVRSVTAIPLWGLQDVKESWQGVGRASLAKARSASTADRIRAEFLPALRDFLRGVLEPGAQADDLRQPIHAIYRYLREHDLRETMRSPLVWEAYVETVQAIYAQAADELLLPDLELWELTTGMQWVTRWLFPLAAEIPRVDVVHAAMAGICTMVSVAAKEEYGAGYLLTEHGVYLRERYIAEAPRHDSYFLKLLGLRFARRMTELTYVLADQISPCCDYNGRWEREVGARPDQLQTIYYGVDSEAFSADQPVSANPHTVVWVGRINPLKDVETLLRAAAHARAQRPDIKFLLYGGAPEEDAAYYQGCLDLHAELGLGDSVVFCGYTRDPAKAFLSGDVVVLSSISEGFPYSTLEAMLCGRPIVATSVGGLPEQIEGVGTVVEPRNPVAMAEAILDILGDPERCAALGVAARERAMGEFGHTRFRGRHQASYLSLSERHGRWKTVFEEQRSPEIVVPEQMSSSEERDELAHLDLAVDVEARSPVPLDELEVAAVIESLGVTDRLARARYGERDVFSLATSLFSVVTAERKAKGMADRGAPPPRGGRLVGDFFDAARFPAWSILPSIALLTTTWLLGHMGHWSTDRVLAFAIGMSVGMLSTNGLALAMGRRASAALSLGKIVVARRFFLLCLGIAALSTAAITVGLSFLHWAPIGFLPHQRAVFVATAVTLSVVWITASAMSLVSASGVAGVSLCLGVATVAGVSYATAPITREHVLIGAVTGALVALVLMLWALHRQATRVTADKNSALQKLPSPGYLVVEGTPYFLYGTLAVVLFASVHLIGWAYLGGNRQGIATLELGLFLPLLPAVLAAGGAERGLRDFWEEASALQRQILARDRLTFGEQLYRRFLHLLGSYLVRLLVNSVFTALVIEVLLRTHVVSHVIHYSDLRDVRILYVTGLVAYGLMGLAQFCTMFALSFVRCGRPLRSITAGLLVTVLAAVLLAQAYGVAWVGLGLAIGALVYAVDSFLGVRPLLAHSDHHYVAAV